MESTLERAAKNWDMIAQVMDPPSEVDHYDSMLHNIEMAIDFNRERSSKTLLELINSMSAVALAKQGNLPTDFAATGVDALKYLVKLHGIRQNDLPEIGSQGVVSEVLNGRRGLTLRHIRGLAQRFNVSPLTFIDF